MQNRKITKLLFFMMTMACLVAIFAVDVYAQEPPFECSTDPELMQQLHSKLVQKKLGELNQTPLMNNGISTFSQFIDRKATGLMPSTGNVRILVLPIEFADMKMPTNEYEELNDEFFADYDAAKPYGKLSVKGMYKRLSYGKLNITGDILPLYSAPKTRDEYDASQIGTLITEALNSYDINYDNYDSNKDGYIDCLFVKHPFPGLKPWMTWMISGLDVKPDKANGLKFYTMVLGSTSSNAGTDVHEMAHMMGLPDNYPVATQDNCLLDNNCADIMAGGESDDAAYLNIFHKYLLDWVEPKVLPYTDTLQNIELNAVEPYTEETADNNKAVIFISDKSLLPFSEFYMAEYRAGGLEKFYTDNPGIVLWHCKADVSSYGFYNEPNNYIKPVYKSGGSSYSAGDVYTIGDEFSNLTSPSSKLSDDIYTGAYMKVLSQDSQKTTISAGFKAPDLSPAPSITISAPSKKAVKSGENIVYTIIYDNAETIDPFVINFISINCTGTTNARKSLMPSNNIRTLTLKSIEGEGTLGITLKAKSAHNTGALGGIKYAPSVTSTTFYVDDTSPEIVLNGDSEVISARGTSYAEQGA